ARKATRLPPFALPLLNATAALTSSRSLSTSRHCDPDSDLGPAVNTQPTTAIAATTTTASTIRATRRPPPTSSRRRPSDGSGAGGCWLVVVIYYSHVRVDTPERGASTRHGSGPTCEPVSGHGPAATQGRGPAVSKRSVPWRTRQLARGYAPAPGSVREVTAQ